MAVTYTPIATTTVGSDTSTVTFSSIPATYTDLVLVCSVQYNANSVTYAKLNNDSTNKYSTTFLYGDGGTPYSTRYSQTDLAGNGIYVNSSTIPISGSYGIIIYHFMNYSNTTTYKTVLHRAGATYQNVVTGVNLYASTSAINQIVFGPYSNLIKAGSTFTLYGITAAA